MLFYTGYRASLFQEPSFAAQRILRLAGEPFWTLPLEKETPVSVISTSPDKSPRGKGRFEVDGQLKFTWYQVKVRGGEQRGKVGWVLKNELVPRAIRLKFAVYYPVPDRAFERAAKFQLQEWQEHCERVADGRDPKDDDYTDVCICIEAGFAQQFVALWSRLARLLSENKGADRDGRSVDSVVLSGHLFLHASKNTRAEGLEFAQLNEMGDGTLSREMMSDLPVLPWAKSKEGDVWAPKLLLLGCNTGAMGKRDWCPAQVLARSQQTTTLGYDGFSYFSRSPVTFITAKPSDSEIYLKAYRISLNTSFGLGDGSVIPPILFNKEGTVLTQVVAPR